MTNRERYVRTFQTLHASRTFMTEVSEMKKNDVKFCFSRRAAVAILACAMLLAMLSAAYAADLGGIRRQVQVWIHGAQTEAELTQGEDNSYKVTWQDEDGEIHEMGGGGIAYEPDGSERPLTMEEYLEHLNEAEIVNTDDGRVMVYYYDQAIDVTDAFDEDDNCRLALTHDGETTYFIFHGSPETDWSYWSSPDGFEDVERIMEVSMAASAAAGD